MDRQLLEIATLFEGKSKPSLPRIARLALIGTAVVFHVFIALFSAIAPNPNKTAIYYAPRVLLMLFGGSGATIACVITYINLLKRRLNRFVWMLLAGLAIMGYQFLLFIYQTSLIFHILLCSFTTLFIVYHVLFIHGRFKSDLMIIILALFGSSMVDTFFEKNDGHVVKSAAYVFVVVAAILSQMLMDNLAAAEKADAKKATDEEATGSLQKIVDKDDGKV
ncbi:uncharacterized protein LOC132271606 [Cornus florida]|uniref:uncharacterized protein LOC132271606 n=1 Tax=Cornus florida TaxID=4283 RepID=UPI00289E5198|nr:uncharacterized protein LOC132271606 [Cornus florida]